jgi:hypothetical protein
MRYAEETTLITKSHNDDVWLNVAFRPFVNQLLSCTNELIIVSFTPILVLNVLTFWGLNGRDECLDQRAQETASPHIPWRCNR